MKIQNIRLRNITTGILHTEMSHIYIDIEAIIGSPGIMTHHLGIASLVLEKFLRTRLPEEFFDGKWLPETIGETEIDPLSKEEIKEFFESFNIENRMFRLGIRFGSDTTVMA